MSCWHDVRLFFSLLFLLNLPYELCGFSSLHCRFFFLLMLPSFVSARVILCVSRHLNRNEFVQYAWFDRNDCNHFFLIWLIFRSKWKTKNERKKELVNACITWHIKAPIRCDNTHTHSMIEPFTMDRKIYDEKQQPQHSNVIRAEKWKIMRKPDQHRK